MIKIVIFNKDYRNIIDNNEYQFTKTFNNKTLEQLNNPKYYKTTSSLIYTEANVDEHGSFRFWYNQTVDDFLNKNITIANPIEQLPTKKEYILNEIDKAYNSALNYHK